MAKRYLNAYLTSDTNHACHTLPLCCEQVTCSIDNIKLTGNVQRRVTEYCSTSDTLRYLQNKGVVPEDLLHKINWLPIGVFLRHRPLAFRVWMAKHSYGFASTGTNMVKWGLDSEDSCPCCGSPGESLSHLYECPDPRMVTTRTSGIESFRTWMVSSSTNPDVVVAFVGLFLEPSRNFGSFPTMLNNPAALEQDRLGRWNTLIGRLSRKWEMQHSAYLTSLGLSRSSSAWAAGMVEHLLLIGHRCWTTRNNILHADAFGSLNLHSVRALDEEISSYYALGTHDMSPIDHHLILQRELPDLLKLPTVQKRLWLQSIRIARDLHEF